MQAAEDVTLELRPTTRLERAARDEVESQPKVGVARATTSVFSSCRQTFPPKNLLTGMPSIAIN